MATTQDTLLERLISHLVFIIILMINFSVLYLLDTYLNIENYYVTIALYIIIVPILFRGIVKKHALHSKQKKYRYMTFSELLKSRASFKDIFKVTSNDLLKLLIELLGYPFIIFAIYINIGLNSDFLFDNILCSILTFIIFNLVDTLILDSLSKNISKTTKKYASKASTKISSAAVSAVAAAVTDAIENTIEKITEDEDSEHELEDLGDDEEEFDGVDEDIDTDCSESDDD